MSDPVTIDRPTEGLEIRPEVSAFFHSESNTISYLVSDPDSSQAVIIDPVLDYDAASGRTATRSADALLKEINDRNLNVDLILETHIHADHMSAADYLKSKLNAKIAACSSISNVQKTFQPLFNLPYPVATDGRQFDRLLNDGEILPLGALSIRVIATPGHTPACLSFHIGDAVFVGDTLFMPDYGTARCDFPGGDASTLFDSIEKILHLPDNTRMFLCHDYPPQGRPPQWETSVGEQKQKNIHIAGKTKAQFTRLREDRDAQLAMPSLILPSIQINMQAGALPPAEENGISYLKIPLNAV